MVVSALLRIVSWAYAFLVSARNAAYDLRIFRRYTPPVPVVVSIGNIVAGGTGKTPLTSLLLKALTPHFQAAVLTRGYRSRCEHQKSPTLISSKSLQGINPQDCGDEPYMLARNHPDASVYVGKNRRESAIMAAKEGAKLLILDDGLQHRKLARDFELVLMDADAPFGKGGYLPAGDLRDTRSSLARANLIVIGNLTDPKQFEECRKKIARWTDAPLVAARQKLTGVFTLTGEKVEIGPGEKVGAFCGIARPERLFRSVKEAGFIVVDQLASPDHVLPSSGALEQFSKRCIEKGAKCLLCTEKDAVKLDLGADSSLPIYYVKMELEMAHGIADWENLIENIVQRTGMRGSGR